MKINLSVIIINYNTSALTFNCVLSILTQTSKNLTYEIIVIDNASSFEEYNDLKKMIDQLSNEKVFLFRSKLNGGFSAGNMLGVQFAKGEYLAFINNDVLLVEDSFTYPIDYLKKNKHVGIVGIQPIFENNEKQVAFGHFDTFTNRLLGYWLFEKLFPKKTKRHLDYKNPISVDYVVGSYMLMKASHFYNAGGFDVNLFLYFEEMDICKRFMKNNLATVFIPHINYIHINGASTSLGYVKKIELKISHLYVVRKNYGFFNYALLKYFFIVVFLLKSLVNPKHLKMLYTLVFLGAPLASSIKHKQMIQER